MVNNSAARRTLTAARRSGSAEVYSAFGIPITEDFFYDKQETAARRVAFIVLFACIALGVGVYFLIKEFRKDSVTGDTNGGAKDQIFYRECRYNEIESDTDCGRLIKNAAGKFCCPGS